MRTTLLLRVASVTSLLFAAGHTVGGTQEWSPMGETDVLQAMRTHRFDVMGLSRTYLDFYRGFGYTLTVTLLLQAVLLWQLASLARTEPRRVSPMGLPGRRPPHLLARAVRSVTRARKNALEAAASFVQPACWRCATLAWPRSASAAWVRSQGEGPS